MVKRLVTPFLAAAIIASVAAPAAAVDTRRCASSGSTTVYKSSEGRFFKKRGHYYSCSYREGKKFRLAESGFSGEDRYGPFRIHSRYGAYAYRPSCGACESTGAYVLAQDMRTGHHLRFASAMGGRPVEPADGIHRRVTDLELKRNGSVAWIVEQTDLRTTPAQKRIQVRSRDTTGAHRLDEGPLVELRSLTLSSSTLRWRNNGVKTAQLR
jgi:hypothetical protein